MGHMGRSSHPKHVADFVLACLVVQRAIRLPDVDDHILAGLGASHVCLRDIQRVEVQAKGFVAEPYRCKSFTTFATRSRGPRPKAVLTCLSYMIGSSKENLHLFFRFTKIIFTCRSALVTAPSGLRMLRYQDFE